MLGERQAGIALLKQGFQLIQNSGSLQATALYASMVADHMALAGMREEAIVYSNKALDFYREFGEGNGEAPAHRALALAAAQAPTSDWPTVEHHMNEGIRAARQRGEQPHLAITLFRYGELLRARHDPDAARPKFKEAQRLFAAMRMQWWLEEALRAEANSPL